MPKIFKGLTSISAWLLVINGAGSFLWLWIESVVREGGIGGEPYNFADAAWATFAILSLFLGVLAMKIRKELE